MRFPNGFTSWYETHYEVCNKVEYYLEIERDTRVSKVQEKRGRGGLYELAKTLTDEFETKYEGKEWDGEFFDAIDLFLNKELK